MCFQKMFNNFKTLRHSNGMTLRQLGTMYGTPMTPSSLEDGNEMIICATE